MSAHQTVNDEDRRVARLIIKDAPSARVKFGRTNDWYDSGGGWYRLSSWLNRNFRNRWEYYDECVYFTTKEDMMWFKLRWE